MPTYLYLGYNAQGQKTVGSLYRANRVRAERQLALFEVCDYELYTSKTPFDDRPFALVKPGELAFFCRAFAYALTPDSLPAESLAAVAATMTSRILRLALTEIVGFLNRGHAVSCVFKMYEHIFGAFLPRIAAAGEAAGRLSETLADLADYYEKEARLIRGLRGWPLLSQRLPWLYREPPLLVKKRPGSSVDRLAQPYGRTVHEADESPYLGAATGAEGFPRSSYLYPFADEKPSRFRRRLDELLTALPVLRYFAMRFYTGRLTRGLALMLRNGVSPNDPCLKMIVGNRAVEKKILHALRQINAGRDPSAVLESTRNYPPHFPVKFHQLAAAGFQNGNLAETMEQAARRFGR